MIRPHVVSFLDEMLKSEKNLRIEKCSVPLAIPSRLAVLTVQRQFRHAGGA